MSITQQKTLVGRLGQEDEFADDEFVELLWQDCEHKRFHNCKFDRVTFRDVDLESLQFDDCTFIACVFDSTKFVDCTFDATQFYDAETEQGCSFKFGRFDGSQFTRCDLTLCNFARANLYRVTLRECQATGIDLSHVSASRQVGNSVVISDAWIHNCNFAYADFSGSNFSGCDLSDNRMIHCILARAIFWRERCSKRLFLQTVTFMASKLTVSS